MHGQSARLSHRVDAPVELGAAARARITPVRSRGRSGRVRVSCARLDHAVLARPREEADDVVARVLVDVPGHMEGQVDKRSDSPPAGRRAAPSSLNRRMPTFEDLGLSEPALARRSTHLGYERPTPIQEQAIPPLLAGRDVIGQAQTGTGKTAAFGLPMVEYVDTDAPEVQALVLTPTRELCIQVTQALRAYGERAASRWWPSSAARRFATRPRALKEAHGRGRDGRAG